MSAWKRRLPKLDPAQASVLLGVLLAMVVAVLGNVAVGRHYTRFDWTTNKRFTLTPATLETLRSLPGTVHVWVLLGSADPLEQSVKQLLVAYQAETTKLEIHYVDPDRDIVALEDVKKRFNIETGRTEQGHIVADAVVVVAYGERRWFVTTSDMVELSSGDDTRVKPKEERALTGAIRNVLSAEKAKLCFTSGHGEMSPEDTGREGAGGLRELLVKDNYDVVVVDPGSPGSAESFAGCTVVVVAGMRGAFADQETERLRAYLLGGGNMLLAVSPITGATETGLVSDGLDRALMPFGIALGSDLVIEQDAERAFPGAGGIRFVAEPRPHAITQALVRSEDRRDAPRAVLAFSRSLRRVVEPGSVAPTDLLMSSASAFGLTNVAGASEWKDAPQKKAGDLSGPLALAMASERAKSSPSAAHGPRVVVLGTASMLTSPTVREPMPLRGAALLVEGAISWLAAKPQVLDVPDRAAVAAGIRITEDDRAAVRRYVMFMMPGTAAVLGLVVAWWRRRGEGAPHRKPEDGRSSAATKKKRRTKPSSEGEPRA